MGNNPTPERPARIERTPQEIQKLKQDWANDPCWDLEDTEGFEAHREELKEFSDFKTRSWNAAAAAKLKTQLTALSNKIGFPMEGNLKLLQWVLSVEERLKELEGRG